MAFHLLFYSHSLLFIFTFIFWMGNISQAWSVRMPCIMLHKEGCGQEICGIRGGWGVHLAIRQHSRLGLHSNGRMYVHCVTQYLPSARSHLRDNN